MSEIAQNDFTRIDFRKIFPNPDPYSLDYMKLIFVFFLGLKTFECHRIESNFMFFFFSNNQ